MSSLKGDQRVYLTSMYVWCVTCEAYTRLRRKQFNGLHLVCEHNEHIVGFIEERPRRRTSGKLVINA